MLGKVTLEFEFRIGRYVTIFMNDKFLTYKFNNTGNALYLRTLCKDNSQSNVRQRIKQQRSFLYSDFHKEPLRSFITSSSLNFNLGSL